MTIQDLLSKVKHSKEFKDFHSKHKDYYLTHLFTMMTKGVQEPWQAGFYSKKSDKIVVFELNKGKVSKHNEEEVFKQGGTVKELVTDNTLSFEDALITADTFKKAQYPSEIENQKICILQNIDLGTIWNITIISIQFNMINIKIEASTGEILTHSCDSILRLGKDKV